MYSGEENDYNFLDETSTKQYYDNYDDLEIDEFLCQLEFDGYENRHVKTNYMSYEYYKQIFHYSLVKKYNINNIFLNYEDKKKNQYNTIHLTKDTNVNEMANVLYEIFIRANDTICIFLDNKYITGPNWHTTLFIYRPNENKLEHYDSEGDYAEDNMDKFFEIIDILHYKLPKLSFVTSIDMHPIKNKNYKYVKSRSLNFICHVVNKNAAGWCQIWSLFIYELVNRYKNINTDTLISSIYDYIKGGTYGEASYKALNIIRGYYNLIINRTNEYIKEPKLKINKEMLAEFDPSYVKNDMELIQNIISEMNTKVIFRY